MRCTPLLKTFIMTSVLLFGTLHAKQQWVTIPGQTQSMSTISMVDNSANQPVIDFQLSGYFLSDIDVDGEKYQMISAPEMTPLLVAGAPDLPKFYRSIIIPDDSRMRLSVEIVAYHDVAIKNLAPSKGNFTRDIDPSSIPYEFGQEYQNDAFYPENIASLSDPYVLRDTRGAVVQIHPFRYNPKTATLRVYTQLRLTLETAGLARQGLKSRRNNTLHREFLPVYEQHFINYDQNSVLYDLPIETGRLFIISGDNYYDATLPLVNWKRTRGLETEIMRVSEIGNNPSDIFSAVQARYNSVDGLTFFLIVGDAADVAPAIGTSGAASGAASDPSYALLDGGNGDQYPDIFVGRISANTIAQVETQIAKIIDYEANPDPTGDWYQKAIGIASTEGAGIGDDGEADYVHMNNIRTDLLGYGYDPVDQIYDPSASASAVTSSVNEGRGLINYVGHGSTSAWSTTGFSTSNVGNLTNTGKLPVIISVACVNGNFQNTTCFAEAWLRAGSATDQRGAVAMYASTINQSWAPPMCAQDEFNDLLVADAQNTIGSLMFSSSAQMIDEYGTGGFEMYATWHIFGDPSMPMRTRTPSEITDVSAPDILVLGTSQLSINVSGITGGVISLSRQGELLSTAPVAAFGATTLNFEALTDIDTCVLTITGHNRIPWTNELLIISPDGPYLMADDFMIDDAILGNNNGRLDYGETVDLNLFIHNVGALDCAPVNASLVLDDPYVSLSNSAASVAVIGTESTVILGPYELIVAPNTPDGHELNLEVLMDNTLETWVSEMMLTVYAPNISFVRVDVLDENNGRLDIGESAAIEICLNNIGGADLVSGNLSLSTSDPYVLSLGAANSIFNFQTETLDSCLFDIAVEYATPPGHNIEFIWVLTGDQGYSTTGSFAIPAGLVVEDFETGGFSTFDWILSGHSNWLIDSEEFQQGLFSARSGSINNYQNSEMTLLIDVDEDAEISFSYKVSSEAGADGLDFLIDGIIAANWQGEFPWSEATFVLPEGEHELIWRYSKNSSGLSGDDCAWVDFIILPISEIAGSIIGDVTADTHINVQDIVRMVGIILGQGEAAQDYELYCGDVNGDAIVDIGDLVLLVNIIMGDNLGRLGAPGTLDLSISSQGLLLNSTEPIMALDLTFTGLLNLTLQNYQTARNTVSGVTHLIIYNMDLEKAVSHISLGEISEDFELISLQAAYKSGQVIDADLEQLVLPERFYVYQNFPNPFNPQTTIAYELAKASKVNIQIYDLKGRELATLQNQVKPAGYHELAWDASSSEGKNLGSGVYLCRIIAGENQTVLKLMLMK